MFDLFNVDLGGGGGRYSSGTIANASSRTREVTLRRPGISEWGKKAKALIKALDLSSIDYYELAEAIWEFSSDAQKIHFYRLVDGLINRALIHHDDGTAYTLVEKAIGERADLIRETVYKNG